MLLLMMLLTATTAWAQFSGGDGSQATPYQIASYNDLKTLRDNVNSGTNYNGVYFKQTANIVCNDTWIEPIGKDKDHPFGGHYDGDNKTIQNFKFSSTTCQHAGLFGYACGERVHGTPTMSSLKNIVLEDCDIQTTATSSYAAGISAGNPHDGMAVRIDNCRVSGTISGVLYAGGIIQDSGTSVYVTNCFADVTVSATTKGKIYACVSSEYGTDHIMGNYYHDNGDGVGYSGGTYTVGTSKIAPVYTVNGTGFTTAATNATVTHGGKQYFLASATATITPADNTAFKTFSVSGATGSSLAADKKSATINLGTNDATVTTTLQALSGSCGTSASWTLTQDGSGNYTRLTISGTGTMKDYTHITNGKDKYWRTSADWGYDLTSVTIPDGITSIGDFAFCGCQQLSSITIGSSVQNIGYASINYCDKLTTVDLPASVNNIEYAAFENCANLARVNIGKSDGVITGENPFNGCHANLIIALPTPALVLQYKTASIWSGYASKLRAAFASQLFTATGTVDDAAYEIATEDDLRNLSTAVNAGNDGNGLIFRQTADIAMSNTNFTPIGANSHSFRGTYDGGHHVVSGLTVNTDSQNAGLFGKVEGGTIKDLAVVNPTVSSSYASNVHIGAIVGYCNNSDSYRSRLTNLYTHGTNLAVVGQNDNPSFSTITNVSAAHKVILGDGVTGVSPAATEPENGFVYDKKTYYREGVTLTLASNTPEGYVPVYSANSTVLSDNTYTVNSNDGDNVTFTVNYEIIHFTQGDLSYECTSGTEVKVTACNPGATMVTIPTTVSNNDGTYNVTAIDAAAFSGCRKLLYLILNSETPPTLGSDAFDACWALNAIIVPSGKAETYKAADGWAAYEEYIMGYDGTCGTNVYYAYNNSTKTLVIFGTGAMADYEYDGEDIPWHSYCEDISTVVIGNGVTTICNAAFYTCINLTSIEIPSSVTSIGDIAFNSCTSLTSIEIPSSVTSIGEGAFAGCESLESIEIPASVTSIGKRILACCLALESISVASENPTYHSKGNCIIETESHTLIQGCKKSVIPDYVTSIGEGAFSNCTSLTSIEIPAKVTSIGDNAFEFCTSLTNINIPASVTSIGDNAFEFCTSLTNINIPASVTSIGDGAFYDCESLTSITIPASVMSIGEDAFAYCTSLLYLTLNSETPPTLGDDAFDGCTALYAIIVPLGKAETYKAADDWKDYADKICDDYGTCGADGSNVYYAYNNSTKALHIFGTGAMEGNSSWNSYRKDIKTVIIDNGVTSIGFGAFADCANLLYLTLKSETPTTLGEDAFSYCTALKAIVVPSGSVPAYKSAEDWAAYEEKILGYDGTCGTNVYYSYDSSTKTLHFFGTGSIENNSSWNSYHEDIKTVVIDNGVTSIGDHAFEGCTSLANITIPGSVTSIGDHAFEGCTSLTSITIPNSVTSIGDHAFEGCTSLTSITIPNSVTSIGDQAFDDCESLTSITIPNSVTCIGDFAFYDCTGLASVTIYASELSYYGNSAFHNNASGRKIYVFRNCLDTYKEQADWMCVDPNDIEAITLRFYESTDNGDAIDTFADLCNGENKIDVTLQGRTLYKDGDWNTIVLPFDVEIKKSVLDGADVRALADANLTGDVLTLNFTKEGEVSTIEAGKPYIIKWKEGENLVSPVFQGVTVDATTHNFRSEDGKVYFKGTYAPLSWNAENQSILFLGEKNTLYWPLAGAHLNAFRAYFELMGEACAREFVMNFEGETTGVVSMYNEQCTMNNKADAWYTVNGVKLDGKPTTKGMYIKNGKKVVVK